MSTMTPQGSARINVLWKIYSCWHSRFFLRSREKKIAKMLSKVNWILVIWYFYGVKIIYTHTRTHTCLALGSSKYTFFYFFRLVQLANAQLLRLDNHIIIEFDFRKLFIVLQHTRRTWTAFINCYLDGYVNIEIGSRCANLGAVYRWLCKHTARFVYILSLAKIFSVYIVTCVCVWVLFFFRCTPHST